MRDKQSLESIKSLIDNTYNRFGRHLQVNTSKPFDPLHAELGYCYKFTDPDTKNQVYRIVCAKTGNDFIDFRVLMHEYGHIYLTHLEGLHEELDNKLVDVFEEERDELIKQINESCGIDFAEKLLERVIDDPGLNHSLHNIAMDMEVNSSVLSLEDVEEMEKQITAILPKYDEEYLKYIRDKITDEEQKKKIDEKLDKMEKETKIKLIHPSRYYLDENTPFPDNLTYPDYLILIVKHLDQFVKMLISIKKGGNGDTSQVSKQEVSDALNGNGQGQGGNGNQQGQSSGSPGNMDYNNGGGGGGMKNLDDLLNEMGMTDSGEGDEQDQDQGDQDGNDSQGGDQQGQGRENPYKGIRGGGAADRLDKDPSKKEARGGSKDHGTEERDKADRKRELGQIKGGGGLGCGSSGGPDATRLVDKNVDEVEMALQEVLQNYSSKIIEIKTKKDQMYLWNRGIQRSGLIVPTYRRHYDVKTNPTITFLIDISGSMDTQLVNRILKTISAGMKRLGRGLKYNIITWSTCMGEELKNLDARKPVPRISMGGGTEMAGGMKYFKENYGKDSILVLISDFEDYLDEWHKVEETMDGYTMYGFNYGYRDYGKNIPWKNFKVRHFNKDKKRNNYYGY